MVSNGCDENVSEPHSGTFLKTPWSKTLFHLYYNQDIIQLKCAYYMRGRCVKKIILIRFKKYHFDYSFHMTN